MRLSLLLTCCLLLGPALAGGEGPDLLRSFITRAADLGEDPGQRIDRLARSEDPLDRREAALRVALEETDLDLAQARNRLRDGKDMTAALEAMLAADEALAKALKTKAGYPELQRALGEQARKLEHQELPPATADGEDLRAAWEELQAGRAALEALRKRRRELIRKDEYLDKLRADRDRAAEAAAARWCQATGSDPVCTALAARRARIVRWLQELAEERRRAAE